MRAKTFTLTYPWKKGGYEPEVTFHLSADEVGFHMHIVAKETDPRRTQTENQTEVYKDSCVEWFVNFAPEVCDRYFNMETNANGAMYAAFRKDRYDYQMMEEADIESMNVQALIHEDAWEVRYQIPFALIQKYIPGYHFEDGQVIRANFYKCGDGTAQPHYGMWNEFFPEKPDFHRPEFFGEIVLD